jgi:predicted SprT family Zn-dependent metalloprotease
MTVRDLRLQRIAYIFDLVNRNHFEGIIPRPQFRISNRITQTAARVWYDEWVLEVSAPYHDHHGWHDELVCNVKHEVVHLYLHYIKRPSGHTKEFTRLCTAIGGTRFCKKMPRTRPYYFYTVQCPRCRRKTTYRAWKSGTACGECCAEFNGGKFSTKFILKLLKRTEGKVAQL